MGGQSFVDKAKLPLGGLIFFSALFPSSEKLSFSINHTMDLAQVVSVKVTTTTAAMNLVSSFIS